MLLVIGWLCTTVAMPLRAQCPAENKAFKSGEQVVYDLYFKWKFILKKEVLASHPEFSKDNAQEILRQEVGAVFEQVLCDAGVFKRDEEGKKAFARFVSSL